MFDHYLHPWELAKREKEVHVSDFKKIGSGGLWIREGKKGKFLSGQLQFDQMGRRIEVNFVSFKNDKKDNPKQPDYRIVVMDYKDATKPKEAPYQPPNADDSPPF